MTFVGAQQDLIRGQLAEAMPLTCDPSGMQRQPLPQPVSIPTLLGTTTSFHRFPELPLEIRRMVWNLALRKHFIPLRAIELSNTVKVPIPDSKHVERTKTSVMLLTSPDEVLDSVKKLVASCEGDVGHVALDSLSNDDKAKEIIASDPESREKALNDLLEKRIYRRTHDDLNLVNFDVLTATIPSRLSANSQYANHSYQRYATQASYIAGLRLVCRESYKELSRGMETTLGRNFSSSAVVFNDIHKSVTRMTGIPGAGRASLQSRADFFFPSERDNNLSEKPTAHFAMDLEIKKGKLLAPGIQFYPEKSTIFYQGTLNYFFESCLSCPTPSNTTINHNPAYTTTYSNIKYLAVEQDPRDLMNVSWPPRNYGVRLDGLEELTFVIERPVLDRQDDNLPWGEEVGAKAQTRLEEKTRVMIEGWGFGAPKRCSVVVAREFWGM